MTTWRRLQIAALSVVIGGGLFLLPAESVEAATMGCPENLYIDNCDSIPPWLDDSCAACGRTVGCHDYSLPPNPPHYGAVAGCNFDM